MKREEFLKLATLAFGGSLVSGCDNSTEELLPSENGLNVILAKKYFENVYLPKVNKQRVDQIGYKRVAKWEKALLKNNKNEEFVVIPIDYDSDEQPGFLVHLEGQEFKQNFLKEFTEPIKEVLIVRKKNKKTEAFLAQLSYDPYKFTDQVEKTLKLETLNGWLIMADWNDVPIKGLEVKNGIITREFDQLSKKQKIETCDFVMMMYNTVQAYWDSYCNCQGYNVTAHRTMQMICTWGGGQVPLFNNTDPNMTYYYYYNGQNYVFNPYVNQGNFLFANNTVSIPHLLNDSTTRNIVNSRISKALDATGLANSLLSFSYDKALAIVKSSFGADMNKFANMQMYQSIGKKIGIAGLAIDGVQVFMGLTDGEITNEDLVKATVLGVGAVGFFVGGWFAVAVGGVSIIINVHYLKVQN